MSSATHVLGGKRRRQAARGGIRSLLAASARVCPRDSWPTAVAGQSDPARAKRGTHAPRRRRSSTDKAGINPQRTERRAATGGPQPQPEVSAAPRRMKMRMPSDQGDAPTPTPTGFRLRPACAAADAETLWAMLAYASHPDDDAEVPIERLRQDPHLRGYVEGWGRRGDIGCILEDGSRALGAAWVRLPAAMDRSDPTYVDEDTPWLAIGVVPSARGHGWVRSFSQRSWTPCGDGFQPSCSRCADPTALRTCTRASGSNP